MTREERYINHDERIDRYLRNLMGDSERAAFEQDVDNDQQLRERLVATAMLVQGIAQEGMRREGQAQLDAIKQMSLDEYKTAIQDDSIDGIRAMIPIDYEDDDIPGSSDSKRYRPFARFMKWASGIAAVSIVAYGLYTFIPKETQQPEMAEIVEEAPTKPVKPKKHAKPTLASLVDAYNKPFAGEPDAFVDIREQIRENKSKDMMAVVYDIDKVEWPTANHGPKGADDNEEIKNTTDNFNDCSLWYKALAYLKKGDKESAINKLDELTEKGHNEVLIERASELLKKLKE